MKTHNRMRRMLSLLLIFASLLTLSVPVSAYYNQSGQATNDLKEAQLLGILPDILAEADMQTKISRLETCYVVTLAYEKLTGNTPTPNRTDYFTDTDDAMICAAYEIGIINGYTDGTFRPDELLTRQEFFLILSNLNSSVGIPINIKEDYLKSFADRKQIPTWAERAAQEVVGLEIVFGGKNAKGEPVLMPQDNTKRQDAIVMILRCFKQADMFLLTDWLTEEEIRALRDAAIAQAGSQEAADLVSYALGFVGKAYVFGATGPNSFDCSGFTQYVYKHFGYTINRVANDQVKNGVSVSFDKLQPGDLICFSNTYSSSEWITHVGIYIGDGKMVHAANTKRGVTVDSITSGYYYNHYAAARRILK